MEEVSTVFTSKNKCNNEISTSLKYAPHLGKNKCCGLNEAPIPRIPSQACPELAFDGSNDDASHCFQ